MFEMRRRFRAALSRLFLPEQHQIVGRLAAVAVHHLDIADEPQTFADEGVLVKMQVSVLGHVTGLVFERQSIVVRQ